MTPIPVSAPMTCAALRRSEREHIRHVLERCNDDKREAARRLGLGLSSLYRKLEEMGPRRARRWVADGARR